MTQLPQPITEFSQYMLIVRGRSPRTVEQYQIDLILFFKYLKASRGNLPLEGKEFTDMTIYELDDSFASSVTRTEVFNFLGFVALTRDNGARTRARKLSALKSFYKYFCNSVNKYQNNPTVNIDSPKIPKTLPRHLTQEESITLLESVDSDVMNKNKLRDYCIVTLFLNCGMRLSELVGINVGDIDRNLTALSVMGKGAKERMIYLNDACRTAIRDYLEVRDKTPLPGHENALFLSKQHKRLSKQMVQTAIYKYLGIAGLSNRKFSVHKLRHTAATLMYQSGKVDVRVLKDILGHEQLTTTQIYTHLSDDSMKKAMDNNPLSEISRKKSK